MRLGRLEPHQVDHVHDPDLEVREFMLQQLDRRQRFKGGDVTSAGHDDVGLGPIVAGGPLPDADAGRAVGDRRVHVQVLQGWLLPGHDDVDVVAAAQAMVNRRQQRVGVRRQVDADHLGLLVHRQIDEAGVLV